MPTEPAATTVPPPRAVRTARVRARLALGATLGLLALAWVGRAATSSDGAEVLSDTFGLVVRGRLESATAPPERVDPYFPAPHPFRSRYGALPSLLPAPFLAAAWPFRAALGPEGLDAALSLTWAAGAALAAVAFLRLVRALEPRASPLWAPAFLAGTFVWPYAADSYVEPWAAAALALGAAELLRGPSRPFARGLSGGAGALVAALLKPILWVLAPVFVFAALLADREGEGVPKRAGGALAVLVPGLAGILALNVALYGRATDFGYGYAGLPFDTPLTTGLYGLLASPGRGLLFYAPIAALAPLALRRTGAAARVLCGLVPLTLVLVAARWFAWHGASCWGPRLILPVLPLLAAPAVLLPRGLARAGLAAGAAVNLLGVLVAPGAFLSYAEALRGGRAEEWPAAGADRAATVPRLSPLLGHAVLLGRGVGIPLPSPWLAGGVTELRPLPGPAAWLSPRLLRRVAGLPPVEPLTGRLLARIATAEAVRGRPEVASLFAREALALDPRFPSAPLLRALARPPAGPRAARPGPEAAPR